MNGVQIYKKFRWDSTRKKVMPKIVFENHDRGIRGYQKNKKYFFLQINKIEQNNTSFDSS